MITKLEAYHQSLLLTFDPIEPSSNSISEVALRIFRILIAPFAYTLWAVLYFFNNTPPPPDHLQEKALKLKNDLAVIKLQRSPGWQEKSCRLIRIHREYDPHNEVKRLRYGGTLSSERETKLDQSIAQVNYGTIHSKAPITAKMLYSQALEIKDIYASTHYVFIHSQATKWTSLVYLIKESLKIFEPKALQHHFKYLRSPTDRVPKDFLGKIGAVLSYIWNFGNKEHDVRQFLKDNTKINDSEMKTRELILSVDAYFFNYMGGESALSFLIKNQSDLNNSDVIKVFAQAILKHYNPNLSERRLNDIANRITKAVFQQSPTSNLFVIAIPKSQAEKTLYRAHPYGPRCACHPPEKDKFILEELQNERFNHSIKCRGNAPVPQYRLYTPTLDPKNGTKIFLLTPFSKASRKVVKNNIKQALLLAKDLA